MEDGPPIFRQDFSCPALLVADLVPPVRFCVRGYHPVSPDFPDRSTNSLAKDCKAVPLSLATTDGISVDFCSSGYLDVSVPQVSFSYPMNSGTDTLAGGFPHSEILGSKLVCQLPGAYRRLRRPSSPDIAKASTVCAYSLDHITPKSRDYMFWFTVPMQHTRLNTHASSQGYAFNLFETSPLRRSLSRALLLNYPNCKRADTTSVPSLEPLMTTSQQTLNAKHRKKLITGGASRDRTDDP